MSVAKRLVLFVAIVAVVVAAAAGAGLVLDAGEEVQASGDLDEDIDSQALLSETSIDRGEGEISVESDESKRVLIDRQHGNAADEETLQPLVRALTDAGHEVVYLDQGDRLNQSLSNADAFVIVEPGQPYTTDEVRGVEAFADAGGRVLMMDEPNGGGAQAAASIVVGSSLAPEGGITSVSSPLGITFGTGYLYNMEDNGGNFQTVYAASGDEALVEGVDRTVFHNAAPVYSEAGTPLVTGIEATQYSETQENGEYHVAVRNGDVVAVGDTDFLAHPDNNREDNEVLVSNLAEFLVGGEKSPEDAPQDGSSGF